MQICLTICVLVNSVLCTLVFLSKGEHYTEVFEISKYESNTDCDETKLQIIEHTLIIQEQMQDKIDIVRVLYYDQNIILQLERAGVVTILQRGNSLQQSPFIEINEINLNTNELDNFQCDDMTQYSAEIFLAVCTSNDSIFISKIRCNNIEDIQQCQSTLYEDKDDLNCNNHLNIITESTWRYKDPEYFSIYCQTQEGFSVQNKPILLGRSQLLINSQQYQQIQLMSRMISPIYSIEKVSFFDENTLMILDHHAGLFVYRFSFNDIGEIFYTQILWQLFLPNELFYSLSYSHEQYAIRFPPENIIENDIQYSVVILSNKFLYELALPQTWEGFYFTTLAINDKINMNGQRIHNAYLEYDEQFYYACVQYEEQSGTGNLYSTQVLRIQRHTATQSIKQIYYYNSSYDHPIMLAYSYGQSQTNLLISQQTKDSQTKLSLIQNEIERISLQSLTDEEFQCEIIYKSISDNVSLFITNRQFESTLLLKVENQLEYQFPNTDSTVKGSSFVRGPAPILQAKSDKQNIEVDSYSGYRYALDDQLFESVKKSRISLYSFVDQDFKIMFLQLEKVNIILQYDTLTELYFSHQFFELQCSQTQLVKQIVGISPYYAIFYSDLQIYTLMTITLDSQTSGEFQIICKNYELDSKIYNQNYQVYVDLNFINLFFSTENAIYYSNLDGTNLRIISTQINFRQLNFQLLKNDIILGSYENKLYKIDLNTNKIEQLQLMELTNQFKFFVVLMSKPIPMLIIIDQIILLYSIENLDNIQYYSTLPQFGNIIKSTLTEMNYYLLIVPTSNNQWFIYDLTKTGTDRLEAIQEWKENPIPLIISYPKMGKFQYYVQDQNGDVYCYFEKRLEFQLKASDPTNIDNNFQVTINAQSALGQSQADIFTISGSFRYQDTMIQKSSIESLVIEIFKTNYTTELNVQNHYQGPIFSYELQDNKNCFNLLTYIRESDENLVRFKVDQNILGTTASKEFLIILGDETINIINILQTQYFKQVIQTAIDYEDIMDIFFNADQPTVSNCTKSFINSLTQAELSGIHIITLFCESVIVRVGSTNNINQLSYTILSDNEEIEQQFLNNFFFLDIEYKDFIYQNQSAFIVQDYKMINFPQQFKPTYKFYSINAMVKGLRKYDSNDRDDVICIFFGSVDLNTNDKMHGTLLDIIGAVDFDKNTLIVNNFQMICLSGCQIIDDKINTMIELIFNDMYDFNLYRLWIKLSYKIGDLHPEYTRYNNRILNIQKLITSFIQNQLDFTYIDTQTQYIQEVFTVNVTTDSLSFDLVEYDGKIVVEHIFKQYTQCPSPSGSLKASLQEYFAISCKNSSEQLDQQTQFVKLFLRDNQQSKSVIQASKIEGELMLLDIQQGLLNEKTRMLILEQLLDDNLRYTNEFQLRWFQLNNIMILEADQSTTPTDVLYLQLCPNNLNELEGLCMEIEISNTGYNQYIKTEILLFSFLMLLPLFASCSFVIYGIINYKNEKQKRIEEFGKELEESLKNQVEPSHHSNNIANSF